MVLALAEQSNFSAGQIDAAAQRDKGKAVYQGGCSKARNMRILTGGAMKRRPGSWRRATLQGQSVATEFVTIGGTVYMLCCRTRGSMFTTRPAPSRRPSPALHG
jgi:hypothetical protein